MTSFVTVAETVRVAALTRVWVVLGAKATEIGTKLIVRVVVFDASPTAVAVTVTVVALVTAAGAVYVVDVAVEPLRVPWPVAGERVHVTPRLLLSLATVAVIATVFPAPSVWAALGLKVTEIGRGAGVVVVLDPHPPPTRHMTKASTASLGTAKYL